MQKLAEKLYLKFGNTLYMSRIGKKPISIPEKTEVTISGSVLTVKGPSGSLSKEIPATLEVTVADKQVVVAQKGDANVSVTWGTFTSLVGNMIEGVNTPFMKRLLVEGVGYKWDVKGDMLNLSLGFSHPVNIKIPANVKVVIEKGVLVASSIDKEAVGQFAAYVRSFRKPEPFKGKGIRYEGEVIRRKEGKKTV